MTQYWLLPPLTQCPCINFCPPQVYLWHVDMGSLLTAVDSFIIAKPLTCAFSADDSKLAITDSIGDVIVWNILAGCQW